MSPEVFEVTFTENLYRIAAPKLVVVLSVPWEDLSPEEQTKLREIFDAVRTRINPEISLESARVLFQPMLNLGSFTSLPLFLVYFGPLPEGVSYYERMDRKSYRMLASEPVNELIKNEKARHQLWQGLQQLFKVQ